MADKSPTPPEASRADVRRNRDRILDAAALVLSRDANASLATIADAADLSRATAYRHFADVDAVRAALLAEAEEIGRGLLQEHLEAMFSPENEHRPSIEVIDELLALSFPLRHRWTIAIANEPVWDAGLVSTFAPIARGFLRRGQLRGEFRDDLDTDVVGEALAALAIYAVRRVHSDGLAVDQALSIMRPFLDGLVKSAERRAPVEDE